MWLRVWNRVCLCVCGFVSVGSCVWVRMSVGVSVRVWIRVLVRVWVCVCTFVCVGTCVLVLARVWAYVGACVARL